jgi:hypothetical protein
MTSAEKLFEYQAELKAAYSINETACGNTFGAISQDLGVTNTNLDPLSIYPNPFFKSAYN